MTDEALRVEPTITRGLDTRDGTKGVGVFKGIIESSTRLPGLDFDDFKPCMFPFSLNLSLPLCAYNSTYHEKAVFFIHLFEFCECSE